jgi:hypothetical protein
MNARILGAGALALALAASTGFPDSPTAAPDLEARVEALEKEVQAARADLADASKQLAEEKKRTEEIVAYLAKQAEGAKAMAQCLDASEKAGFTYGINPDSRVQLLAGWKAQLEAVQTDVPAAKKADKAEDAKRSRYWSTKQ